jgi:hypothetical protein
LKQQIEGCIEALNLCHQAGRNEEAPAIKARVIELYETIVPPDDQYQLAKNEYGSSLVWEEQLLKQFRAAGLSVEEQWEYVQQVEDKIIFNHLVISIIEQLAAPGREEKCMFYIGRLETLHIFKEEDRRFQGYRVLLRYAAERADTASFFRFLPLSEPIKERHEIDRCKTTLVARVSKTQGWEAAVELCRHKKIGDKYVADALRPLAEHWTYEDMKRLFEERPDLDVEKRHTRLKLLVEAHCEEAKRDAARASARFDELFRLADATDPEIRWGDLRLRDGLLMDIGLAAQDPTEVERCRKAIKNNSVKKELKWWLDDLKKRKKRQKSEERHTRDIP